MTWLVGRRLLVQVRDQIPRLTGPWFRGFLGYDPGPTLTRINVTDWVRRHLQ